MSTIVVLTQLHLFLANGFYVSPTAVDGTGAAAKILTDGTIHDSIGPLRKLGSNTQSAYTLVVEDAGKYVAQSSNSASVTVPNSVFAW